jgi:hypothetical protein
MEETYFNESMEMSSQRGQNCILRPLQIDLDLELHISTVVGLPHNT